MHEIYLIECTDCEGKKGFVSYGNRDDEEYRAVDIEKARAFPIRKDAQRVMDWYIYRGGIFSDMKIIEKKLKPLKLRKW